MASMYSKSYGLALVSKSNSLFAPNLTKVHVKKFSTSQSNQPGVITNGPSNSITTNCYVNSNYHLTAVFLPSLVQKNCFHAGSTLEAPKRAGFFGKLYESVRQEFEQNKEVKDSIKKFREETNKLDESDALKNARKKYQVFEDETSEKGKIFKEKLSDVSGKLKEGIDEFKKSEIGKQTSDVFENVGKGVITAGETISKSGKVITESEAFQTISNASEIVKQNIDEELARARVYSSPKVLKRRSDFRMFSTKAAEEFDPETHDLNESELRMELHRDAKWYATWENFKDTNPVFNKMFDLKNQYQESENPVVAGTRFVSDKVSRFFGGVFAANATSEVMSEIRKVDPNFTITRFNDVCHKIIFPHVVEALFRSQFDLLEDWCTAPAYNKLRAQLDPLMKQGYKFESYIMDVGEPDIETAVMEQSMPVLVSRFNVQAICTIKDSFGKVITLPEETTLIGGAEEGEVYQYMWFVALTRDMEDIDPISSWRIGDVEIRKSKMAF